MKLRLLFIPLTLFLFNNTCLAKNTDFEHLHKEIQIFFKHYLDHYNDYIKDNNKKEALLKATNDLNIPSFQIPPQNNIMVFESHEPIKTNTEYFLSQFQEKGIVKISWKKTHFKVLNPQAAIASNIAILSRNDNSIVQEVAASYLLHKSADQWKIIVRALHPIENSPTFN